MTNKEKRSLLIASVRAFRAWQKAYEATPSPEANENYEQAKARWADHDKARDALTVLCVKIGEAIADRSTARWMIYSERASLGYWKAKKYAEMVRHTYHRMG